MKEWVLRPNDPYIFTLAVDARISPTDYTNDQIWELIIGRGFPPAISIQTTYGLRARNLRVFPRFGEGDRLYSDPSSFSSPVSILKYCPNYIRLNFSPLPNIQADLSYWVPDSHTICGKLTLENLENVQRQIQVEIAGNLTPDEHGTRLTAVEFESVPVLTGQTGDLVPVLFLAVGAKPANGPYPALAAQVDLPPSGEYSLVWALATLSDTKESLAHARQQVNRNWEAEITRIELLNEGRLEIYTGEPDWDHAFDLAQTMALNLFVGPTQKLPHPSFVIIRQPDQGYSLRGDGSDYNHLWNGQTPLEAYALSSMILPIAPEFVKGLILNFLSTQTSEGEVEWKPGLGGHSSKLQATPLLASLTWLYYEFTEDRLFLQDIFQKLIHFIEFWISARFDHDRDGIPEWSHPNQQGLDDHPLFTYWHPWSLGRDINTVESPDLCAYLYRECVLLLKMAHLLRRHDVMSYLKSKAAFFRKKIDTFWDVDDIIYYNRDRDTHTVSRIENLGSMSGSGSLAIQKQFPYPTRLLIHIHPRELSTRRVMVFLHGTGPGGAHRVERITTEGFKWIPGRGTATSERLYTEIEHIETQGLIEGDQCSLFSAGLDRMDISLLLPIWAGAATKNHAQELIQKTILDPGRFWSEYGLRNFEIESEVGLGPVPQSISFPWNQLIGDGLLTYQYRDKAAELFIHLMQAAVGTLQQEGCFRRNYHAITGKGNGEPNALHGLPPVGMFMKILGVRFITPKRIFLEGFNPFPWPVTVKYRGTTVLRQREKTSVIYPDGQTITTERTSPTILTLGYS